MWSVFSYTKLYVTYSLTKEFSILKLWYIYEYCNNEHIIYDNKTTKVIYIYHRSRILFGQNNTSIHNTN